MIKALSIIFLILGWLCLSQVSMPKSIEKNKQFKVSLLLLAIGTICTLLTCIK